MKQKGLWDVVLLTWPLWLLGFTFVGVVLMRVYEGLRPDTFLGMLVISLAIAPLGAANLWFGLSIKNADQIVDSPVVIKREATPRLIAIYRFAHIIGGALLLVILLAGWIRFLA